MSKLPRVMYAIPGQHDLPFHSYDDIEKSAFWTLVKGGIIKPLAAGDMYDIGDIEVYGCPWEQELCKPSDTNKLKVAVIHSYIWFGRNVHKGADPNSSYNHWLPKLEGFHTAVFGDNHKGFHVMSEDDGDPWVLNCGTFMRRKADELEYKPKIGLLHKKGNFTVVELDCSEDKFIDIDKALAVVETTLEMTEFIKELSSLKGCALNFVEAIKSFMKELGTDSEVRQLVLSLLEK
jgi:hypothetical protein